MIFSHAQLVQIAERWLLKRCGFAFNELSTNGGEIPDCIGFNWKNSILIECKTSRADFFSDQKKVFRHVPKLGVGTFRFFMCEKGLIKPEELPDKWGLIYVNTEGAARKVIGPKGKDWETPENKYWTFEKNKDYEYNLMFSALRRLYLQGVMPKIYEKYRG